MRVLFLSDIHGSFKFLSDVDALYSFNSFDKIILLGDLLYHGPRNPLPEGYDCMETAMLLNKYSHNILAVRGNCDSEVDQMVLDFNITSDFIEIALNGFDFFITHGHLYDSDSLPNRNFDVFVHGHYHVPMLEKKELHTIINPSSVSLPKQGERSFGVLEGSIFKIINCYDEVVLEKDLSR